MKEIQQLIQISKHFGQKTDYVIAGGGNTSWKNASHLWIKASGHALASIDEDGFVQLDRSKLQQIASRVYSDNPSEREDQVKQDLLAARVFPEAGQRPSVETSLHELIPYAYVVHTHPTLANAVLCSQDAENLYQEIFGEYSLFIPYTDPGYVLFKKVEEEINRFQSEKGMCPKTILLQNHGIFVAADTPSEIITITENIEFSIRQRIKDPISIQEIRIDRKIREIVPGVRMLLSESSLKSLKVAFNNLIENFAVSQRTFEQVSAPFTPDMIVYCKSRYMFVEYRDSTEEILAIFRQQLDDFRNLNGYDPQVIIFQNLCLVTVGDHPKAARDVMEVFLDLMQISYYTNSFGGPRFMTPLEIAFIENWEVENYRRQVALGKNAGSNLQNRVVIITGGAQGFGAGITEHFFQAGANVVVADLNEEKGPEFAQHLNSQGKNQRALFVQTDVSSPESVKELMFETVRAFGGLDVIVSNAGVLKAGGLDEMDPAVFDFMTEVNYKGYFLCAKYSSALMKLQHRYNPSHFMDIIQINSKSGLKGSNKNFAYAGGKFGGIGLTQSFAMELVPFNIKVNSICPGNFFDGPLWNDPEKGLFMQYLKTGKVAGAKTIEDVKRFYEEQVPMRRGCTVDDVMKAVFYVISQQYETGQAVPVTGGQIMLS